MADNVALGTYELVLGGLSALLPFITGAPVTGVLVNYARHRRLASEYALPLILEAVLLLGFGMLGMQRSRIEGLFVPATVMLLSFTMGLHNALITKLSNAVIRITQITGIGIELRKLLYGNSGRSQAMTPA